MQRAGIVYREEEPAGYANVKFHTCKFIFVFFIIIIISCLGTSASLWCRMAEEEGEGGGVALR